MTRVILSNGHDKFILAPLAAEVARRGWLDLFFTGTYPTPFIKKLLGRNAWGLKGLQRLLSREEIGIPLERVRAQNVAEIISQCAAVVRRFWGQGELADWILLQAMRCYSRSIRKYILKSDASIYHFRSGYGLSSISVAKRKGMVTVCDHSIANPEVLESLVASGGRWPEQSQSRQGVIWQAVLADLRQCDHIIVNSHFVKDTFTKYGWHAGRIWVNYVGVDDDFFLKVPTREKPPAGARRPRLLFAGDFSKRKGGDTIARLMEEIGTSDFSLEIICDIHEDLKDVAVKLRKDPRVTFRGFMPRADLARRMTEADIFIFPSVAEGSARVVFMAMACGCYVITTPNAGTIVEDGIHGKIVQPGNVVEFKAAVLKAMESMQEVDRVGAANSRLIRSSYRQSTYGEGAIHIYTQILQGSRAKYNQ